MQLKNYTHSLFALCLCAFLIQNCASLTGFQDGRTCGQGNGEIFASLNVAQSPDFLDIDDSLGDSIKTQNLFAPIIEAGGRYGVTEKVDLIGRLNIYGNISLGAKAQLLGDRTSKTALSVGAELGTLLILPVFYYAALPVNFSVHPKENFTWYLSPRVMYQSFQDLSGATYLGGNTGILLGARNQFGIDLGYSRFSSSTSSGNYSFGLLTFGLGGKFKICNNEPDTMKSKQTAKKKKK
jgi:hypothetical protein